MDRLSLALLGPMLVQRGGEPLLGFESDKVRALLAYLAVEADRPHRRAALAALLWPERPERAAQLNLNQALANLRRTVGDRESATPLLLASRESVGLNPAAGCASDLADFRALLDACAAHAHRDSAGCAECAERMERALGLYRGDFLAQFAPRDCQPFQEWAVLVREQSHRRAVEALERLAAYHERRGDTAAALRAAYRQAELDPWREEAHRLLMRLLWGDGQRSAALAQYDRCRAALAAELGLEPEPATTALYEQIRAGGAPAPAAPPAAPPASLPRPTTPFLGRARELAQLAAALGDPTCRLVTIVGLGGSGKTRLAIQAAAAHGHAFADGVCFVPLASLAPTAALAPAIARQLGLQPGEAERDGELLLDALRGRRLLLLLDNLEHLAGAARLVGELLAGAPELTILATSRERLGLRAEWTLDVAGLEVPDSADPAALAAGAASGLFLQSARRARASFAPGPDEGRALLEICGRLGGHPLAIELAAAWARTLSCAEIAAEIAAAGLDLLGGAAADLPERHQSIRAVFATTWRMLPAEQRRLVNWLAVFQGGFDREACGRVARASLAQLAALSNMALLARGDDGRYALHELVRQYAAEGLALSGEAAAAARAHGAHFFDLLERADPHMKGADESAWMDRLEADHDNLRAALGHALAAGALAEAARACELLRWFWYIRGHSGEGGRWTERVLDAVGAGGLELPVARRGKLLQGAGIFADEQGDYVRAAARYGEALALYEAAGDMRGAQAVSNSLGMLAWAKGDYGQAQARFARSLTICRELGHGWGEANALNSLGTVAQAQGDLAAALAYYEEALALARAVGYEQQITLVLDSVGEVALAQGDLGRAAAAYGEALERQGAAGDSRGAALSRQGLGMLALAQGDLGVAAERLYAGLREARHTANRRELSTYVDHVAALLLAQGELGRAAQVCAATATYRQQIGATLSPFEAAGYSATLEAARQGLGQGAFAAAWARGAAAPLDRLIGELLADRPGH